MLVVSLIRARVVHEMNLQLFYVNLKECWLFKNQCSLLYLAEYEYIIFEQKRIFLWNLQDSFFFCCNLKKNILCYFWENTWIAEIVII